MSNALLISGILLIIIVSVVWAILRGLAKARIRGICILVCAILAVILTVCTRGMFTTDKFVSDTVLPWLTQTGMDEKIFEILGVSSTLDNVLINCIVSLASPFICVAYFLILSFLTWIVFLILTLVFHTPLRMQSRFSRFRMARTSVWGLVQSLVLVMIFLLPLATYLEVVPTVADEVLKTDILDVEQEENIQMALDDYINPANDGVIKVYRAMGGGALSNLMTDFELNDTKIDLSEELDSIASFGCNIYSLTKKDFAEYGEPEALVFTAIADSFDDSVLLPTIAGEVIYSATEKWLANETFLGAAKPTFGEMNAIFAPFFDTLLDVLHEDATDYQALQADFHTVAEMVSTFAKHGVFSKMSDTEKLMTALSSDGIVESMITTLGKNESMKVLIPEITNMGVRAVATTLGIPADVNDVYGDFMNDVASAVNYSKALEGETRAQQLTTDLTAAFDKAGIPVDTEIIDCYSVSMINDLIENTEKDEITTDDVQAFFAVYALTTNAGTTEESSDATETVAVSGSFTLADSAVLFAGTVYEGMTEGQLKASGAAVLANAYAELLKLESTEDYATRANTVLLNAYAVLLEEKEAELAVIGAVTLTAPVSDNAFKATVSLQSADQMITQKVTLDAMLLNAKEASQKINDQTIASESAAIASIFKAASDLQREMNHSSELKVDQVAGSFGSILDSLNGSATFGSDKTASLFTAVLQSETVRKTADLDMATATQMAQKATEGENINYTQTMNAVSGSVNVLTKLGKDGEQVSEEELVELIRNINPQTAGMIEVYATPTRIESYKVSPKYSGTSSELICSTFHYMAIDTMSEEQYQKEAKALNQVLNIALSAKEHSTEQHLFTKEGQTGILPGNATETVETFMNSNAICYGLRTTMLDENGNIKDGKFDAFDLAAKLPETSTDYQDCLDAIEAYYAQHRDEQTQRSLLALSALLGVDASEILG